MGDNSLNVAEKVSLIEECRAFANATPKRRYAVWYREEKSPLTARGHLYKLPHEGNSLETEAYQSFPLHIPFRKELHSEKELPCEIRDSKRQIAGGETAVGVLHRQAFHEIIRSDFDSYLDDHLEKPEALKKTGAGGKTAAAKAMRRSSATYINHRDVRYTFQQFAKAFSAYNVGMHSSR